jgi:Mg-chelatase subunit ChlD
MTSTATTVSPEQTAMIKAMMSEYDIHLAIDTSGSMAGPHQGYSSRWAAAKELATQINSAAREIDTDGINLVTFGATVKTYTNVTNEQIDAVFAAGPNGGTPLTEGLNALFQVAGSSPKKDLCVVLTDGEPANADTAMKALIAQANSQTADDDCTVLFIQLGNDAGATKFLTKMDDELPKMGAKFDIVDAVTCDQVYAAPSFAHVLQAAITG